MLRCFKTADRQAPPSSLPCLPACVPFLSRAHKTTKTLPAPLPFSSCTNTMACFSPRFDTFDPALAAERLPWLFASFDRLFFPFEDFCYFHPFLSLSLHPFFLSASRSFSHCVVCVCVFFRSISSPVPLPQSLTLVPTDWSDFCCCCYTATLLRPTHKPQPVRATCTGMLYCCYLRLTNMCWATRSVCFPLGTPRLFFFRNSHGEEANPPTLHATG